MLGIVIPASIRGRFSTKRCRSYPKPTLTCTLCSIEGVISRASNKSASVVIFILRGSPLTRRTRCPALSTNAASSVHETPDRPISIASSRTVPVFSLCAGCTIRSPAASSLGISCRDRPPRNRTCRETETLSACFRYCFSSNGPYFSPSI